MRHEGHVEHRHGGPAERHLTPLADLHDLIPVGSGAFAEVFSVFDAELGRRVALKRLTKGLAERDGVRRRFSNEYDLLGRCAGAFVLVRGRWGTHDGAPAYTCELCTGTVNDRLRARQRPLPVDAATRVVTETLVALDRVHRLGVVHRDIKPSNVLFADDGSVRLADFGIALHPEARMTVQGQRMGTPAWVPRQMIDAPQDAAPSDDLFGVAMLLIRMVTGVHPKLMRHPDHRASIIEAMPAGLRPVVLRAASTEPARRYRSAADMLLALRAGSQPE